MRRHVACYFQVTSCFTAKYQQALGEQPTRNSKTVLFETQMYHLKEACEYAEARYIKEEAEEAALTEASLKREREEEHMQILHDQRQRDALNKIRPIAMDCPVCLEHYTPIIGDFCGACQSLMATMADSNQDTQ